MLKVTTVNVNGIRAAARKDMAQWLKEANPDILCLQEVRAPQGELFALAQGVALAVDLRRGIVLAYDSGNAFLRAWDLQEDGQLSPRWERPGLGCASHMLLYEDSGEVVTNDHHGLREEVVVLDIATGRERARAATGGRMQGVVFPSPGWGRDLYWCSMDRIARLHVTD